MTYTFNSITDFKEFYPHARYLIHKSTNVVYGIFAAIAGILFIVNVKSAPLVLNIAQAVFAFALLSIVYTLMMRYTLKKNFKAAGFDRYPTKMVIGDHALNATNKRGNTVLTLDDLARINIHGDAVFFMVDKTQGLVLDRKHLVEGDWDGFLKMLEANWKK